jgi:hypothetical protein
MHGQQREDVAAFEGTDELPPSVDEAAVRRMRLVARGLDELVRVPGTDYRVGLDPLLGVIPGAGDVVAGAVSLYVVAESARLGVSYGTLLRMLANVAVDVAGGSVPYVGVLFDAVWKANEWNVELALEDLAGRADGEVVEITVE